jgi:hypothetical protein
MSVIHRLYIFFLFIIFLLISHYFINHPYIYMCVFFFLYNIHILSLDNNAHLFYLYKLYILFIF